MKKRRYWTGAKRAPAQDEFFIAALDPDLWERGDEKNWDACWHTGMPARGVFRQMRPGQWVNHIPGNHALTVKSRLYQTLAAARQRAPASLQSRFGFFPKSYLMPDDYHALQRDAFAAPEKRWIIKPKSMSRGRGIEVIADAGAAPVDEKMLVQEYLDAPHLFDGRKYVLRCYMAITSVEPLRVYLYNEGFAKLASEPYQDGDFDNLYAHLTNPDVNARNARDGAAVEFHSLAGYRKWLEGNGADPGPIFEGLRDIAAITAIAARDIMRERVLKSGAWGPGCCELIGMDCMIDADLKPWLLECNLSPSLDICAEPDAGGTMETQIKRAVVADLVSMAGLNDAPLDHPDPDDIDALIAASDTEEKNAGGFVRIFPARDVGEYFPFFPAPRYADIAIAGGDAAQDMRFTANAAGEFAFDDDIALQGAAANGLKAPSTAGAYIWLRAGGGDRPNAIARDLAAMHAGSPAPEKSAMKTVWDTLADWGAAGLLTPAGEAPAPIVKAEPISPLWAAKETIIFDDQRFQVRAATPQLAQRLAPFLSAMRCEPGDAIDVSIFADRAGYAISVDALLHRNNLRLAEIADALFAVLMERSGIERPGAPHMAASLWRIGERNALIASPARARWDCLGASLQGSGDAALIAGACRLKGAAGAVTALARPAKIKAEDADQPSAYVSQWAGEPRGAHIPLTKAPGAIYSVDVVILPVYRESSAGATISHLGGRRAFLALAALIETPALTREATASLAQWPDTVACIEVQFSDRHAGARALLNAMSAP